jgi:WD40 repeat protein
VPADVATVTYYLRQLFLSDLWGQYCECVPGSGGTCSAAPYAISSVTDQGTSAGGRTTGIQTTTQVAGTYYGAEIYCIAGGWSSYVRLWDTTTTTVVAEKTHAFTTGLNTVFFPIPYASGSGQNHTLSWTGSGSQHYAACSGSNTGGVNNSLLQFV